MQFICFLPYTMSAVSFEIAFNSESFHISSQQAKQQEAAAAAAAALEVED